MDRRSFFTRTFGAAVVALLAPLGIDARPSALTYLRKAYNDYSKGSSRGPRYMLVSQELFDAAESELLAFERFSFAGNPDPYGYYTTLKFKAANMAVSRQLKGWECVFGG